MNHMPFPSSPSNENSFASNSMLQGSSKAPWKRAKSTDPAPLMFQVHFCDGRLVSYSYCDLREIRLLHAGHLQLCLLGMEKLYITLEGRHLTELADLMGTGLIKSFAELGPRNFERSESSPSIDKITVEELTGGSY